MTFKVFLTIWGAPGGPVVKILVFSLQRMAAWSPLIREQRSQKLWARPKSNQHLTIWLHASYNCFTCLSEEPSPFLPLHLSLPNCFSLFSSSPPTPSLFFYNFKRNTFVSQNLKWWGKNSKMWKNPSPPHFLTNPNLKISIGWFAYFNFFLYIFQTSPLTHSYCFFLTEQIRHPSIFVSMAVCAKDDIES